MKKKWNIVGLLLAVFVAMMVWPGTAIAQDVSINDNPTPMNPTQDVSINDNPTPMDPTDGCPQLFPLDGLSYVFENGTLTYYYGDVKFQNALDLNAWTYNEWYSISDNVKKIVFDKSMSNYHPTNCASLFIGCNKLTEIVDLKYLNTENVTDMSLMFYGCSNLVSIDLSGLKTKNVTNMENMFCNCTNLISLNFNNFNVDKVSNMGGMFSGCNKLVTLDFGSFNTANVTNMSNMFLNCSALLSLDMGSFNTVNVIDMGNMFKGCSNLKTIYIGDNWTTENVTNYYGIFFECQKLVGGRGTPCSKEHWDGTYLLPWDDDESIAYAHIDGGTSNPGYFTRVGEPAYVQRDAYAVFEDGTLTFKYDENKPEGAYENGGWIWGGINADIKVVVFDKSFADYRPTDCAYWFSYCENLTKIQGVENLNTEEVTDMTCMFGWCRKIESLDLSHFNTAKVTDMNNMFCLCENLSDLDISSFNTEKVTSMAAMFYDCYKLTSLDLGNFNTKNVTNMSEMFYGSHGLISINLSSFNTENVTNMDRMFLNCSGLQNLDLSNFNTKNVTSMAGMFQQTSLQRLDLNKFKTENVTNMAGMFNYCSLIQLDLGSFNTKKVTDMSQMFRDCRIIKTIFVGDEWTTAAVTESDMMFYSCANLYGGKGTKCGESDIKYAHIDGGASNPGYFTRVGEPAYVQRDAYAVFVNGMLTFKYDENKPEDAFEICGWGGVSTDIKVVVFDQSFANYKPTNCASWFYRCYNLSEIKGIENFNTENVESMEKMFAYCTNLSTLDLSGFNTGSVENMSNMFYYCSGLSNLNLNGFNTRNVKDMSQMFSRCGSLTSLDLSSFDTQNVTDMSGMFYGNNNLAQINLSSFNTVKVIDMSAMFGGYVDTGSFSNGDIVIEEDEEDTWSFSNGDEVIEEDEEDTGSFSNGDVVIEEDEEDTWSFSNGDEVIEEDEEDTGSFSNGDEVIEEDDFVENPECGCYSLKCLDLSSFNTASVTNVRGMFGCCESLATIYVSENWNNKSVNASENMFYYCLKLVGGKGTAHNSEKTDVSYARIDGGASNPGYFTKYGEPAYVPTSPYATFTDGTLTLGYGSDIPNNATKISGEVIQSLSKSTSSNYIASDITAAKNVQKVVFDKTFADYQPENCAYWFNGCNNLTSIDGIENLDTKNTTDMTAMFQNCEKLACLDLSGFNTTKVTDMSKMFSNCTELATIFVGDTWNMSNVEKSQDMFLNCQKLVGGNGTQYDANNSDEDFAKIDGKNSGYFTKAGQEPYKVAEPYAVFDNGTLTFYYDGNKPDDAFEMRTGKDDGWTSVASEITKVVFDNSFADYRPTSCECWFFNCVNLTKIEGIKNLNTEDVTSIRSIFNRCEKLESIDLSSFNTQNVTNMRCAFYGCTNLKALDLSKFKTEKVTTMYSMFKYCDNLTNLDLSSFNTKNVTDMSYMLDSCINLKTVDLNSFNTKNVTNMYAMFAYCYNLATIDLSNFDTKNVTNMHGVFYKCTSLKTIDVSSFETKNVTDMGFMLAYCEKLQNIDLSNFDTRNVTTMYSMFHRCASLQNLDVSSFDTKNVTDMGFMFADCEKLQNIDVSNFDTRNVKNMSTMFQSCSSLQNLDLSSFNTKNVTDMSYMFTMCSSLNTIYVGDNWSTSAVTESEYMFYDNSALVGGKGTAFNSGKTDKSYARIDGGKDNPGYFTKSGEKPYEETTPVSEIAPAKDNIDIWSFDKTIYVQNPGKEIRIVDMSGRLVKTVKAIADRMEIPMQKSGIYIVKTGAKTQKVMIQ